MATIGGARALGEENRIGSLEPGKQADMVFISTDSPNLTPRGSPVSAVVYSAQAADIEAVICRGKFLMRDGSVLSLDEDEVLRKADETAAALQR
jgi:cytosine/adenosine deaminase-related metal-dependent hydrolase